MDEWSSAEPRPLSFPLRESIVLHSTTPDDATPSGVFVWPDDPDEKTVVLFELSQREYTALSSTIDVGRDIAYGTDSVRLWWLWIRSMVQVPQICAMMIECISSDADVQEALVNALLNNQSFKDALQTVAGPGNPLTQGDLDTKLVEGECDDDKIYGVSVAVIDAMDTANVDLFERIEVGSNFNERLALLYGAIPLLETLPVDEGLELADQMIENLAENYAGQMTAALKKELACDLYCILKDSPDCSITFDDLFNFFSDKAGASINADTLFAEGMLYIAAGTWVGNQIVYATMLAQVIAWRWSSTFLGLKLATLASVARTAPNNPNWGDCACAPPIMGEMAINTAASPGATMQFIAKVGNIETFRVTSMTAGSGYKYASIYRTGASGAWKVLDVDLEVGTFYQWSGQFGIQTPFDAVEGVTYSIPNSLDLYCSPAAQQFQYLMVVELDPV